MSDSVTLTIDDQSVTVEAGTTIHKAAQSIGIEIPTICYHDHCTSNGLCRMCVVEVEGARVLSPACVAQVSEGMKVKTRSERVERSRRTIVEMLGSTVDLSEAPEIQHIAQDYHADLDRFAAGERRHRPSSTTIRCTFAITRSAFCAGAVCRSAPTTRSTRSPSISTGAASRPRIGTFFDKGMPETTCVFCGQCVGVCPTGALKPKREWLLEQGKTPDELMQLTRTERRRKGR